MEFTKNFNVIDDDYTKFRDIVSELDEKTRVSEFEMNKAAFLLPANAETKSGKTAVILFDEQTTAKSPDNIRKINTENLPAELLLKFKVGYPILVVDSKVFFISEFAMQTLIQVCELGGSAMYENNEFRNKLLAYTFLHTGKNCKIVYREEEIAGKPVRLILSVNHMSYGQIQNSVVCDIIEYLQNNGMYGNIEVSHWEVSQEKTSITVFFPDTAKDLSLVYKLPETFVPGITIKTSDTAQLAFTVEGVLKRQSGVIYPFCEVEKKHTLNFTKEKLISDMEKEVFPLFTKIPEKLKEGASIEVTPKSWDLTNPQKIKENEEKVGDVIASITKSLSREFSKKLMNKLAELLAAEVNGQYYYTMYDIYTLFLNLPERLPELSEVLKEQLAKAVIKIPFLKLKKEETVSYIAP